MFDFNYYTEKFDILNEMKGVLQNPEFHKEGDVFIHTQMVFDKLINNKNFKLLSEKEQKVLILSAIFHDVGKIFTTKEENGKITSKFHSVKGFHFINKYFYRNAKELNINFEERMKIAQLVRYHGYPLNFLEKENFEKYLFYLSQNINLNSLYLLSLSDVKGRITKHKNDLYEKLKLFKEYCVENNIFKNKKEFIDDFTRFKYFSSETYLPDYKIYDDTQFEVIIMSGLPGAGKDTYIKNNFKDIKVISLDEIRKILKITPQKKQGEVINYAKEKALEYMRKKETFIWNATNLTKSIRSKLVNLFMRYNAKVKIIYIETSYENLLKRNETREAKVPYSVIERMINILEIPEIKEAHKVEYVII